MRLQPTPRTASGVRAALLAFVLLTGLPILCLTRLWGGVDGTLLAAGFAVTGLSMLSIGAVSLLFSVLCRTVLGAVVCSYGAVFLLTLFCLTLPATSPILFLPELETRIDAAWKDYENLRSNAMPVSGVVRV